MISVLLTISIIFVILLFYILIFNKKTAISIPKTSNIITKEGKYTESLKILENLSHNANARRYK